MTIDFERFLSIARECKAYDVLECWDELAFNYWCKDCGPMTEEVAYSLCRTDKAVTDDREAAGNYFGSW